jgi:hypothetical protein
MIALITQIVLEPYAGYAIIVEVADGNESQTYRRDYRLGTSQAKYGIDDKGDPRRALGQALEELGRSLQNGHGYPLVSRLE